MTIDSMSESCLFQLEKYFSSNPYREYAMNRPYIPISARSNRVNKSSSIAFHQLIEDRKTPLTLDRSAYKLHVKSNLNIDTQRDTHRHGHYHTNSPVNDFISRSATTKTFLRQQTAATRTTNSMKTIGNDEINGIEGNAVRVGTLNDLIKQFHREETRLIHQPIEYVDNMSFSTTTNRLINERTIKQPQALKEYHFNGPTLPRTTSQINQCRLKEKVNNNNDQYLSKRQSTVITSREKQLSICNKFTIIDPFNSEDNQLTLPSVRYIFPPIRPLGYFTKKSIDDIRNSPPSLIKKEHQRKKRSKYSLDSIDQISPDIEENSPNTNKSLTNSTDLDDYDDDLQNPPNTRINIDLKH
jgi:hypothetical protein